MQNKSTPTAGFFNVGHTKCYNLRADFNPEIIVIKTQN